MSKKTVLIVDDDPDFLEQMKIMLSKDFDVITACGQYEAEELLKTNKPAAAVIDLMMENADGGFALAYHIKKIDSKIPVIIMSAVTSETGINFESSSNEEKTWIKADAFLSKPVRYEQLKHEINKFME